MRYLPLALASLVVTTGSVAVTGQTSSAAPPTATLTEADCSASRLGTVVAASAIGEPVRSVTLASPTWVPATGPVPAHCRVDGSMTPIDPSPTARPINFRVLLPADWSGRAAQLGGGGINGVIPNLTGASGSVSGPAPLQRGFATYGSDGGHQGAPGFGGRRGGGPGAPQTPRGAAGGGATPGGPAGAPPVPPPAVGPVMPSGAPPSADWALNDEVIRNLGHMQMKKTHDAAMVVIERAYGVRPRFNYYLGTSQGGREALEVAQRYPADYDGIISNVPIVNFSSLMLAPEWIRIQEKPLANWVTPAKVNAIRGEFMRQCDGFDGLVDGVINHYMACRERFNVKSGQADKRPWASKLCPNDRDPNPEDTSTNACLTSGQIATLELVYSPYRFATPLAHGVSSFGMWVPTTDPSGSGLILPTRFRGQEGAAADAPMHAHLGILGVTGFLMRNLAANPLDYVEGGPLNGRREQLSPWLDSTNPDLSAFAKRGGKAIVTIGTNDTLASPGAQLDYYASLHDRMGRAAVDSFARLFVIPQAGHGLTGSSYTTDGAGNARPAAPIPSGFDKLGTLIDWVERGVAPAMHLVVTTGDRSLPLCSYPSYPRYVSGPEQTAASYECRN
jgi:feruloyl esterase